MNTLWLHIDMDAFFASVEQLDFPELRGKPVIVGGRPGGRGVVSTCSYEARVFGVRSAMPTNQAFKLCPQGIFVHGRMDRYQELSSKIMDILGSMTPRLIQVSVDEAYMDMSGTEKIFGSPQDIANIIKTRVKTDVGLSLSVGAGSNKLIAKMASGYQKPNGFTFIPPGQEGDFVAGLPLGKIWGLGTKTKERLEHFGIRTTSELLGVSEAALCAILGKNSGKTIYSLVRGIDPGMYEGEAENHSISRETTFEEDVDNKEYLLEVLFGLVDSVLWRLHREKARASTLFIKYRTGGFETFSCQKSLGELTLTQENLYSMACGLFEKKWEKVPLRLLGIGLSGVRPDEGLQGELFESTDSKRAIIERTILNLRDKFPNTLVTKARLIKGKHPDSD